MSHAHPTIPSSSNFQSIINDALDKYKKRTKTDLTVHPLAAQLQSCNSPSAIQAILRQQIQGLDQSRSSDERQSRWLDPTVNVIHAFSSTLAAGVGLAFSPANVVFAGIGVLLSAAKDVRASQETLLVIFERIEMFFRRLEIYIDVTPVDEMMDIIVRIMVEVICILGIETKEVKQGRIRKYAKKLIGRTQIEDAMKMLDKLTQEGARMAAAQSLKVTHSVDERVRGVEDTMVSIDSRVAGVDDRVASVGDRTTIIDDRVRGVDFKVMEVIADAHRTADDVHQVKRSLLRGSMRSWLSPPDPSTNHNAACSTHNKKTAAWFFQGRIFQEWKSSGSLLWIHGKPGSGKSVICSTVIQDIKAMCQAGNTSLAYFYFDFRDVNKQGLRDLVSSLLTQLSAFSGPRSDILLDLYSDHDHGNNQPSDSTLVECLKNMLTLPYQPPTYLVIDALDESNTSGISPPRGRVLELLTELVELRLPNLRICVTSRPEVDIRDALEPLTSGRVSLHDQSGQKQDIVDYVKSVVYSNSEPIMKRWSTEDKELVIAVLSERADGMFRWVVCQLETLRHCLPPSVRHSLDELPETLDETYERVLKEIKKPNRIHAHRLLQCLVVAVRPLDVKELAEVLAVDFDDAEGIPKLKPNWRQEDEEQALLTLCSGLITLVETGYSRRLVQFSHFSVKEYLTSARLATSSGDVSRYHIDLEPAHTILAQACMSILLQPDRVEENGVAKRSPLAGYAGQHWITHAQFESVSSFLRKATEYLFDLDKPYFSAWLQLYDIDTRPDPESSFLFRSAVYTKSDGTPLYYAALCGFEDLVEHLVVKYPQHVNAIGGCYLTPLVAALAGRHFGTAKLLRRNGAHVNVLCNFEKISGAEVTVPNEDGETLLHLALQEEKVEAAAIFIEYGADLTAQNEDGETPLHLASRNGQAEVVRMLLEHGADLTTQNEDGETPLLQASRKGQVDAAGLLIEHGADLTAQDKYGSTSLHLALQRGQVEVSDMLIEHGADVTAKNKNGETPLHLASLNGEVKVTRMLIERGADPIAQNKYGETPLHLAKRVEVAHILVEHGANVSAQNEDGETPLHLASFRGQVELVNTLLDSGADVSARNENRSTPLHLASQEGRLEVADMLIEHGADLKAQNKYGETPLHLASQEGQLKVANMLTERGANLTA